MSQNLLPGSCEIGNFALILSIILLKMGVRLVYGMIMMYFGHRYTCRGLLFKHKTVTQHKDQCWNGVIDTFPRPPATSQQWLLEKVFMQQIIKY